MGKAEGAKAFCNWLVRERRFGHNPLAHLQRLNTETDVRRKRRVLTSEELELLIAAAEKSTGRLGRMGGADRAIVYRLAAFTGLRAQEIASLTPRSFALDANPPTVTVDACYSKHRRKDVLPLTDDLCRRLRAYLAKREKEHRGGDERLWPGKWYRKAGEILQRDLAAARAAWLKDAKKRNRFPGTTFPVCFANGVNLCRVWRCGGPFFRGADIGAVEFAAICTETSQHPLAAGTDAKRWTDPSPAPLSEIGYKARLRDSLSHTIARRREREPTQNKPRSLCASAAGSCLGTQPLPVRPLLRSIIDCKWSASWLPKHGLHRFAFWSIYLLRMTAVARLNPPLAATEGRRLPPRLRDQLRGEGFLA